MRLRLRALSHDYSRHQRLSEVMRQTRDREVIEWLDRQPRTSIWTNSVTILEIRFGLQSMVTGKRRLLLIQAFGTALEAMGNRIASFDAAGAAAAELMAGRQKRGRPGDLRDTMIAGIVLAHRATLATRNAGYFEDLSVPVVNPWRSSEIEGSGCDAACTICFHQYIHTRRRSFVSLS